MRAAPTIEGVRRLLALYEAVWTDECSASHCAGQRGGLVHRAALEVYKELGEPRKREGAPLVSQEGDSR